MSLAAFIGTGVLGGAGLYLLTEAMRRTRPTLLGPFEYTAVIWAVLADAVFWDVLPDAYTIWGCVLICLAGIIVAWRGAPNGAAGLEN